MLETGYKSLVFVFVLIALFLELKPAQAQFRFPVLPRNNPAGTGFRPLKFISEHPVDWDVANSKRNGFWDFGYANRYCKETYGNDTIYRNNYCGRWAPLSDPAIDDKWIHEHGA